MTLRKLESFVRQRPALLKLAYQVKRWVGPLLHSPLRAIPGYLRFFLDRRRYVATGGTARLGDAFPCLFDRTAETKIDAQNFYQAVWASRKIVEARPAEHVDVGSDTKLVGILTALTRVTFVDIRPLAVNLENLVCRSGSVLALPFADGSVRSLSSLHVIEHIGLGRYGDPIDPDGTAKACAELSRVLAPGGRLYFSVPVGRSRVQFNGQRVQTVAEVLSHFSGLALIELAMVDPLGRFVADIAPAEADRRAAEQGGLDYALGCFLFVRNREGLTDG